MEVRTRRPGDGGEPPLWRFGEARGPCGGQLQNVPAPWFERPLEVSTAAFDPDSHDIEHLPARDVAEVDRRA